MHDEREPDLNSPDDAIEERVRKMMEPSEGEKPADNSAPKKQIEVTSHDDEVVVSAPTVSEPELPKPKKKKVQVTFHEDDEKPVQSPAIDDEPPVTILNLDAKKPVKPADEKPTAKKPKKKTTKVKVKVHEDEPAKLLAVLATPDTEVPATTPEVASSETKPKPKKTQIIPQIVSDDETEPSDEQTSAGAELKTDPDVAIEEEPELAEPEVSEEAEPVGAEEEAQTPVPTAPEILPEEPAEPEMPEPTSPETEPPAPVETLPAEAEYKTLDAVQDIMAKESDDIREVEAVDEQELVAAFVPKKPSLRKKFLRFLGKRWQKKGFRRTVLAFIVLLLITAAVVPTSRYFVLNLAGVRGNVSIIVIDESTMQPLKNVKVKLGGKEAVTDIAGQATLMKLKLGPSQLILDRPAFASKTTSKTISWGENLLGETSLKPVGTQYIFKVIDFLSAKPISKIEATSGEAQAISDLAGTIKLTVNKTAAESLEVTLGGDGYRQESVKLATDSSDETTVELVPYRRHAFVSRRAGTYDVYAVDVDGKRETMVLKGTGSERPDTTLSHHRSDNVIAVISTRDGGRSAAGALLSTLTVVNLDDAKATTVTKSDRVQAIDWIGNRLVYLEVAEGEGTDSPKRHRLISYDFISQNKTEIAASNYFNDVLVIDDKLFFAPSSRHQAGNNAKLYRTESDGSSRVVIVDKEIWDIARINFAELILSGQQEWYSYKLDGSLSTKLPSTPGSIVARSYINNLDDKHSLWVENRDAKGVLLMYDIKTKDEPILRAQEGLQYPVRWLNSKTVVYRIRSDRETADYVLSIDGGEPLKIRDVADTSDLENWYFF